LAGLILDALRATVYGRSLITKDHSELLQRLREDGWTGKVSDVYTVLGQMIADSRVERRPGVGMWLSSGVPTLWEPDITRVADIRLRTGLLGEIRRVDVRLEDGNFVRNVPVDFFKP
jgi:hypothetical protein